MLSHLELQNFKCFTHAELQLGKITLLTGANSSGKSTLLNGILAALQTDHFPLFLSPNGGYVDLGDFVELSHGHSRKKHVGVGLTIDGPEGPTNISGEYYFNSYNRMPRLHKLNYKGEAIDLSIQRGPEGYQSEFELRREKTVFGRMERDKRGRSFLHAMESLFREMAERSTEGGDAPEEMTLQGVSKGSFNFRAPADFISALQSQKDMVLNMSVTHAVDGLRHIKNNFNFVSSFRLAPQRTYYQVSRPDTRVGRFGDHYVDQISEWETAKSPHFKVLEEILRRLGLLAELKIHRMTGGRFDLRGRLNKGSTQASLVDLGFGISQFLPIVVADLQLDRGACLAMSQPEIHLHPSVQAQFADVMCDRVTNRDRMYIVETHSEYLINRLRLMVAKGVLSEDDVSMVYVRGKRGGSEVLPVQMRRDGTLEGAPSDFFDTYQSDVFEIALSTEEGT